MDEDIILEKTQVVSNEEYERENKKLQAWYAGEDNKTFYFGYKNVELPSGLYEISLDPIRGAGLTKIEPKRDDIYRLPDLPYDEIINDIKSFWSRGEYFKKYEIIQKRGIILHGHPGGGKTSLIHLMVEEIIKNDGLAIFFSEPEIWCGVSQIVRQIEKKRPILCIIEDIDLVIDKFGEQVFLTFLDGVKQIDNVVYLATTNSLNRIPDRIKKRPSRFDRIYELKLPTKADRKFYLTNKIQTEDLKNYDITQMVTDTEKFSMAQLKELVISIFILGNDYAETITRLKKANINDQLPIGFAQ